MISASVPVALGHGGQLCGGYGHAEEADGQSVDGLGESHSGEGAFTEEGGQPLVHIRADVHHATAHCDGHEIPENFAHVRGVRLGARAELMSEPQDHRHLHGELQGAPHHRTPRQFDRQLVQVRMPIDQHGPDHRQIPYHGRGIGEEEFAMAVENAEAPGGAHQQSGAWEQDAHQGDDQFRRCSDRRCSQAQSPIDEIRACRQYAEQDDHGRSQRQNRADGSGDAVGFLIVAFGEQAGVDGDEGGGEDAFAEEILQEVGDAEGGVEGVGFVEQAEVGAEDALPHESHHAAEQDPGEHQKGVASGVLFGHYASFSRTASVTSSVVLVPPMSGVRTSPSASTAATAASSSRAASAMPR